MSIINKIIGFALLIPALFGLYSSDAKDTEEAYLSRVSEIEFDNTLETAIPQTELYNIIKNHFTSPLPEGKTKKKAIVIGYDGCRADALNMMPAKFSGINKMIDNGASFNISYCGGVNYPEKNIQATSTAPGWCSILTGVWADKHGITDNGISKSLEHKTLLVSLVEDKTIDSASFITRWDGHFVDDNSTYKIEKDYCEEKGLDVEYICCAEDLTCANAAISNIKRDDCSDFIFAIYEGPDAAGHGFGFSTNSPIQEAGFVINDILAYSTINAIENRDNYENEDWLIILTSDHGGFGKGHGGDTIQERMTFFVCNK